MLKKQVQFGSNDSSPLVTVWSHTHGPKCYNKENFFTDLRGFGRGKKIVKKNEMTTNLHNPPIIRKKCGK